MLNGLSRTILKMTLPGVPDIYQGTEFWDFSLVDPDNRRPVAYKARSEALDSHASLETLMRHWPDGRIKQRILSLLLHDRAASPDLYAEGDYRPLSIDGRQGSHLIAYIRQHGDAALAVIVPRLWSALTNPESLAFDPAMWSDTTVALPHGRWRSVIEQDDILIDSDRQEIAGLMGSLPFAVLKRVGTGDDPH
jgi:(1->4)-alpha-D-glucan 1-alpha-D-glucosylmutase